MSYNQKQEPGETFSLPVSEELYRTLFEQVSDGVFVADSQGRCLEVNQHGCEMLGYTRQELLAYSSLQLLIPGEDQEHNPIRLNEIQPGTPVLAEQRLRCKNGRLLSTEIKLWRLTDGRLLGAVRDITAYKQIQEERLAHLHFLENMERINQAIHRTNDLEQMMINVLDTLLDVFNCDRAWLVYPCDPNAATWQTPMERTRPNYPGVLPIGVELPLEPAGAEVFRLLLNTNGPIVFGPESPFQVPIEMQQGFNVQSFIVMAFYPKIGSPWSFGLHQCSYPRVWTYEDQNLFQEIGRRLADGLTTLLAYRDLQDSELRYREIFENVSDLVFLIDITEDGRFLHAGANPVSEKILGIPVAEMKGKPLEDVLPEVNATYLIARCQECLERQTPIEYERSFPIPGGRQYVHTILIPVHNKAGRIYRLVGITSDITARKQIEEMQHKQEQEFRALTENSPDFIGRYDRNARLVYVNPALGRLFNQPITELLGKTAIEISPTTKGAHHFHTTVKQVVATSLPAETEVVVDDVPGQDPFYHHLRFVPELDRDGQLVSILFVGRDITLQKRAELEREHLLQQIRQHAQEVQFIIDTVPEGMFLLSANGRIRLTNGMAEQYLALLSPGWETTPLTHLGTHTLADLLTSPPKGLWHDVTAEERRFEIIARPVENGPTNEGWVFVIRDVTREREIQRHVQAHERLAAVGQLAAGIAHDFNNTLAVIKLYTDLLLRTLELPQRAQERLKILEQQTMRASDLIQQILDFSRQAVVEKQPLNLVPFLKELVRLLKRTLPESIEVELGYDKDVYTIHADPSRIQQAIMNLAVNARDAMPEGGHFTIRLNTIQLVPGAILPVPGMMPGEWVQITITDSGTGIPAEVLAHMFEPFFTTKEKGRGTGLGLAQVYGIVQQHEGVIGIDTVVGQGTAFRLYFPALTAAEPYNTQPETAVLPQGQGQVILVVEDEDVIRQALSERLVLFNYRVIEARNGQEAMLLLMQHEQEIALVLSDAVMPGMGGVALFHAMRERGMKIPFVILTGHMIEKDVENLRALGLHGWLSKPPDLLKLARLLQQGLS